MVHGAVADRLEVRYGREVSRDGVSTVEAEYKLFEDWYLFLERDRYDEFNGGIIHRFWLE